jgi:hypothetical protein
VYQHWPLSVPATPRQRSSRSLRPESDNGQCDRLREVYRSAGWPCQDPVEIDLLAAGLLERVQEPGTPERVRLTDSGVQLLARAQQSNRRALSAHDALVQRVAQSLLREGRLVWTQLQLRARLPGPADAAARWRLCRPDVFSIRNTTVAAYLLPVVHEIKVSRADLLGDLQAPDKRDSYLDVGGQCWYVLGRDAQGPPIAEPDEIPPSAACCRTHRRPPRGAAQCAQRAMPDLPFALWMALARATAAACRRSARRPGPGTGGAGRALRAGAPGTDRRARATGRGIAPLSVSVRNLCEFAAKEGDLDLRFTPRPPRSRAARATSWWPAAARRVPREGERPLSGAWQGLRVRGRADGFDAERNTLEEVKTFRGALAAMPPTTRPCTGPS